MTTDEIPVLDRRGLRRFGLTTGVIIAALFGIVFPYFLDLSWPIWPWIVFAVLGIWALIAPTSLGPVYRGWMRFGMLLSKITTPIVLTLLFLITILPGAMLLRLFRKDPMRRSFDESSSYRVMTKQPSVENLEKPY
jgi:amino acid transporter